LGAGYSLLTFSFFFLPEKRKAALKMRLFVEKKEQIRFLMPMQ